MTPSTRPDESSQAPSRGTRDRILAAAIELLNHGGRDALTTRAVAHAAGVQGPTIYRLFGDKRGLLDAVATLGFETYSHRKQEREASSDPVENLRIGWDMHVAFGLSHPQIYMLIYADPRPGNPTPATTISRRMLISYIERVAADGRLRLPVEQAADLLHASASGTVLNLLSRLDHERNMTISERAREAAIEAITLPRTDRSAVGAGPLAIGLRSVLPQSVVFSDAERTLLAEWLDRIAHAPEDDTSGR